MNFLINFFISLYDTMLRIFSFSTRTIKNTLNIYIKTNTGKSLSVDLDPKMDIKNVKDLVAPQLGLQPQEVKIIFAGKELLDSTVIGDCDLGDQSILHAVRTRPLSSRPEDRATGQSLQVPGHEGSKPLCETLMDLQLTPAERMQLGLDTDSEEHQRIRAHFYVYCGSSCHGMKTGKLRVRCETCKGGALTVRRDPCCWDDVLKTSQIEADCEDPSCAGQPRFAHFYFKCGEHVSQGEHDQAVALYLIKSNIRDVPCLACTDVRTPVLVFPCTEGHVTCLECFRAYCVSRLRERQFISNPILGYTLPCPAGCENSLIEETHHFRLLSEEEYQQYQRFAAEEYVLQAGGVLCPQPGCGMGILVDGGCDKVCCASGCGFVFCRKCLQGYHIGDCEEGEGENSLATGSSGYSIDPGRAAQARWDEASKVAIKVTTKPCPQCRTPTERDGGCMHMVCTRAQCGFHWCWVCQTPWTRDCMANHWFG